MTHLKARVVELLVAAELLAKVAAVYARLRRPALGQELLQQWSNNPIVKLVCIVQIRKLCPRSGKSELCLDAKVTPQVFGIT